MTTKSDNPAMSDSSELWRWPATELARGIATGRISSREAVQSSLDRIAAVNPALNALVEVSAETALEEADVADRAVAAGEALGALHGVPVSTKINSDQAGHASTNGIPALANDIALVDSPQVGNLRHAGAILVGRSNTPAFSFRWFTDNDIHGRTLSPWNAERTPGGSSGGAAASVAAGMTPLAHGNDIGGSIRYPAYVNGIAGLRPTVGRVAGLHRLPENQDPFLGSWLMAVEGPLARTIDDLRLALPVMSTWDARDPMITPAGAPPWGTRHVALVRDVGLVDPAPAVHAALDQAAGWLRDAGYQVDEIELPMLGEAFRLWWLLVMEEFRLAMPAVQAVGGEGINRAAQLYYAVRAEWFGDEPGLQAYIGGYARRGTLIHQLAEIMERYTTILTPISAEQAFEQDADLVSVDRTRELLVAQWSQMAVALLGFPALAVPTGVVDGLPGGRPAARPALRRGGAARCRCRDRVPRGHLHPDRSAVNLPVMPPVAPMLAKPAAAIPLDQCYEPKWDGFRSVVFRDGDEVEIGSRKERPMTRYFPEVVAAVLRSFPARAVVDGEIVIAGAGGLDFGALQQRIHPAASRVARLAAETPASFIAFDLLALGDDDLTGEPFARRRALLEQVLREAAPPVFVTPMTTDAAVAGEWFSRFEGAGLDGLIAKRHDLTYQPDKRVMTKIKHVRTADCVLAGYRVHKTASDAVGSLLLGLVRDESAPRAQWGDQLDGKLAPVGVIGAFPMARRRELFTELQSLVIPISDHPWSWAAEFPGGPEGGSRWNPGKDLSFVPLRPSRVVEVRYDYLEGGRFRHPPQFLRWRPDRDPATCNYAQLDRPTPLDLAEVLKLGPNPGAGSSAVRAADS